MIKKCRRALAIPLAAILLVGLIAGGAFAAGEKPMRLSLRVEGITDCIYDNPDFTVMYDTDTLTVADLINLINGQNGAPTFTLTDEPYISAVNGVAAGTNEPMAGWMYMVNGVAPSTGIGNTTLNNNDSIVIYYSDEYGAAGMQFPVVDASTVALDGVVQVTSQDTTYDASGNATVSTNPVAGATVTWDGVTYTTDSNGAITVPAVAGMHSVQVERYDSTLGVPTVLRFAPDYTVYAPYTDTPVASWFSDAIEYVTQDGLFVGMGDNTFAPNQAMTFEQLVQVLYRMTAQNPPSDAEIVAAPAMPVGEYWYSDSQTWGEDIGLFTNGQYAIGTPLTREQFFSMFYEYVKLMGTLDTTQTADLSAATDYAQISPDSIPAISWAVASGMVVGTSDGALTISPNTTITRAEVSQMIMRYLTAAAAE